MTKTSLSDRPNGSRTQRAKRHLAEARRTAFNRLEDGRRQAKAALAHVHEVQRPRVGRVKRWLLNKLADVVVWKIENDTWRVVLERQKLSFEEFTASLRQGGRFTRLARD
jgi:hypothetical protein